MRFGLAATLGGLCLLAGCSGGVFTGSSNQTIAAPRTGAALSGRAFGGQQPLMGAKLYLYAANTTGYGSPSISLLTSATGNPPDTSNNYYVTTAPDGTWGITGDYTCPTATTQVYLYLTGGDPGLGSGSNAAVGELAALGTCGNLTPSTYVVINEVSTVAMAHAVAGYATDALHVSGPGNTLALTGLANAFATVTNIETLDTGAALTNPLGGLTGNQQIVVNTQANILAACVNSDGSVTGPTSATPCYTLFTHALSGGTTGTQPTDTATAGINIAHNWKTNTSALFSLQTATSPFQPDQSGPNFVIGLPFNSGGLSIPQGIAIDSSGNVWVADAGSGVTELSPTGQPISPATSGYTGGGLSEAMGIAIDTSNNVWVTNYTGNSVSKFNSSGGAISPAFTGYTGGGLNAPQGIAIDASNNIWITNNGSVSVSKFNSSGGAISPATTGYAVGGLNGPIGVAIDIHGNVWAANNTRGANSISELTSAGAPVSTTGYSGGGLAEPGGLAIDASGNIWVANGLSGANNISEFDPSGTPVSSTGYTGGALDEPGGIAIDASGNVWAANYGGNNASVFTSSGTPITGSPGGGLGTGLANAPIAVAIDGSGNVWMTSSAYSRVIEFVGAATPVVTPIVANLLSPYGTQAVNKP